MRFSFNLGTIYCKKSLSITFDVIMATSFMIGGFQNFIFFFLLMTSFNVLEVTFTFLDHFRFCLFILTTSVVNFGAF